MVVYAVCAVDPVASLPPSGSPSWICVTGTAITPSRATTPTTVSHGLRVTRRYVPGAVLLLAVPVDDLSGRQRRPPW